MEKQIATPLKVAKELVEEDIAEQKASEEEIAAICALGFERDLAVEALEETVRFLINEYASTNN